jgi:hypothetical protein
LADTLGQTCCSSVRFSLETVSNNDCDRIFAISNLFSYIYIKYFTNKPVAPYEGKGVTSMGLIFLIILIVLLLGTVPTWPYSRGWGYSPSGIVGVLLLILLILLFTRVIIFY